jgi:hypothetical protein
MVHGNVISGDLAASGDPMEYRRTEGWPSEGCSDALNLQVICPFITSMIYKQALICWKLAKLQARKAFMVNLADID